MVRRWMGAILVSLLLGGCRLPPYGAKLAVGVAPDSPSSGSASGLVTVHGSGFGAKDSLYVGIAITSGAQGSITTHYDHAWKTTANSAGQFTMNVRYADCSQNADLAGLTIRVFVNDTTSTFSTSVLVAPSQLCGSDSAIPATFSVES